MLLTISNRFDYNEQNGVTSFKARHKNWRQNEIMEDFSTWGAEAHGENLFCLTEKVLTRRHFRHPAGRRQ